MLDRPYLSTDVLSYLAHGYVGIARGVGNAYSELSRGVLGTSLGDALSALGWRPAPIPSPYGPLWTDIEGIVMGLTTRVPLAIFVFKVIATLASLGSIWLVWRILGRVTPDRQLLGTVLFAWNPVIIVELSGEGHNDALMLFFALAGLYATVRLRPAASLVATTLGTLTKVVPALILPPQLVFLWRSRRQDPTIVTGLAIGALASLAIAVILFVPVWVGPQTFEGLRVSSEPGPWPTVSGALYGSSSGPGRTSTPASSSGSSCRVCSWRSSSRSRSGCGRRRDVLQASAWIASRVRRLRVARVLPVVRGVPGGDAGARAADRDDRARLHHRVHVAR